MLSEIVRLALIYNQQLNFQVYHQKNTYVYTKTNTEMFTASLKNNYKTNQMPIN